MKWKCFISNQCLLRLKVCHRLNTLNKKCLCWLLIEIPVGSGLSLPRPKSSFHICEICHDILEDVAAPEEDLLVDELVVVVKEDGGAVEGGESHGRDPDLGVRGMVLVFGIVAIIVININDHPSLVLKA